LTGLLVALVLGAREPWFVFATAALIAIASKYLFRTRAANVFNPAAVGLVAAFYLFDTAQNWWGALPSIVPGASWPLLLGSGIYVTHRVNKIPLVVAFMATYFTLFAAATFAIDPGEVAEVFVAPDLLATVFFACFMLTDPPTSPTRVRSQIACGALAASASVAVYIGLGAAHYLLSGVLVGNLFEALRRQRVSRPARLRLAA
jgi:Na+-translocating ferredoxin:NAD+ oxidoreductase RnfD subunit